MPFFALQWSHDLPAMDTSILVEPINRTAYFSTLQWSHDLPAMDTSLTQAARA